MRLLLFDIDGTLVSAGGAGRRALQQAILSEYHLSESLDGMRLAGKTDPLIIREALRRAGRENHFEGLSRTFRGAYQTCLQQELEGCQEFKVLPGVRELLSILREKDRFLLGLATGNLEEGSRLKLARGRLESFFSFGGFGCDAEDRTGVVRKAIDRGRAKAVGAAIEAVYVIGDTPQDVIHGKTAGAVTVAVATGIDSLPELERHHPDLAVSSLQPTETLLAFLETGASPRR